MKKLLILALLALPLISKGGSGCVIISAPRAAASTTGSPISTTNGANYVYIFTGSGSITI